jgi:uncharacterized protein
MLLDLSRFRGTADRVERREAPATVSRPGDEFRIVAPVEFAADVRKDQEKVRLVGRMQAVLELDCSRCLDSYQIPVDAPIDLMFLPGSANTGVAEREIEDEDIGVSYYHDDVIDLAEVMREQCHLALPMKPLCRDDCRGLCPVCGVNRNRETCDCQATWVDPRLEPLRALKQMKKT